MAVLDILVYPDPRLKQVSKPVELFDDSLRSFILDLEETLRAGPGGVGDGHSGWLTQAHFNTVDAPGTQAFLEAYEASFRGPNTKSDDAQSYLAIVGDGSVDGKRKMEFYFRPIRSKLFKLLTEHIVYPILRERFGVPAPGRRGRFGLLLEPQEIEVRDTL